MKKYCNTKKTFHKAGKHGRCKHLVNANHSLFSPYFLSNFLSRIKKNIENILSICMHSCLFIRTGKLYMHLDVLILDMEKGRFYDTILLTISKKYQFSVAEIKKKDIKISFQNLYQRNKVILFV